MITLSHIGHLLINPLQPDSLLNASRVRRHTHYPLHLLVADVQNLVRHEESNTLGARWNGQASHVSPEVIKMANLTQGQVDVLFDIGQLPGLIEANVPWPLGDKRGVGIPRRIDAYGQDTDIVTVSVGVHEVYLGHTAFPVDRVLARGVDMPAYHVGGDAVEGDAGKTCHRAFVILRRECRAVSPVEVIARDVLRIVPELRPMERGEALSRGQADGRLLSAVLTEEVFCAAQGSASVPNIMAMLRLFSSERIMTYWD